LLFANAGASDPAGTIAWVRAHVPRHVQAYFLAVVLTASGHNSLPALQEHLPELLSSDASKSRQCRDEVCRLLVRAIAEQPAVEGAESLIALAEVYPPQVPLEALSKHLTANAGKLSGEDWEKFWAALDSAPGLVERRKLRRQIVATLAGTDMAGTRQWIESMPPGERALYADYTLPWTLQTGLASRGPDWTPHMDWLEQTAPGSVPTQIQNWYNESPEQALPWLAAHPHHIAAAESMLRSCSCIAMPEDATARETATDTAATRLRPLVQLWQRTDPAAWEKFLAGIITMGQREILERSSRP